MTADLPSDDDIAAMFNGANRGIWACWAYPVEGSARVVKVWNRSHDKPPLAPNITPLGCIVLDMGT
jgi:hypothetical protein